MGLTVKIVTSVVLLVTLGFLVASVFVPLMLITAVPLAGITFFCYLFCPVAYEVSDSVLTVRLRAGRRRFGPILRCSRVTELGTFTVRLFGVGGLFASTGYFWNRQLGHFRAYATSTYFCRQVLVETASDKVLISPEDPEKFIEFCQASGGRQ